MKEDSSVVSETLKEIRCEIVDQKIRSRDEKDREDEEGRDSFPKDSAGYYCDYCFPYYGPCLCFGCLLLADVCSHSVVCINQEVTMGIQGAMMSGSGFAVSHPSEALEIPCYLWKIVHCCLGVLT
jgi:hypothetical protein